MNSGRKLTRKCVVFIIQIKSKLYCKMIINLRSSENQNEWKTHTTWKLSELFETLHG